MKKDSKTLSLKTETVRAMSTEEMAQVNGGWAATCWTVVVPIAGITTLAFKACRG